MATLEQQDTTAVPISRYLDVRGLTEELAAPLSAEDQTVQSMPDVSPTKWHRAHTTWFFETFVLGPHMDGYSELDGRYGYLFNSYYETVGSRHPRAQRGVISRPGIAEIAAYRRHVDAAMETLLSGPLSEALAWLVTLGLHHEQQHQELLLMDIKHVLSCNVLRPTYREAGPGPSASGEPRSWLEHAGGLAEIGHDGDGFAFDNEGPRHAVQLDGFALASRPVTNGEWLAFIDDGGYQRPELWLSDGWATVTTEGWNAPLYWSRPPGAAFGQWEQFTLAGPRPLHADEPVCHVSYYEADAFARWSGARLPTEAEWEAVAAKRLPCVGEVWEWTASAYSPYPKVTPAAGAVGEYNGKFMVNQHVLRGGSCATPSGHVRLTYRNFFPPSARWAFSGVRLARN